MEPQQVVIWVFLGIFVLTALIALASLIGWVRLEPYYKKKLFLLLILEVVGCVTAFAVEAFQCEPSRAIELETALLCNELGWDWQYADKCWRSRMQFHHAGDDKLTMVGQTHIVGENGLDQAIILWESAQPFRVPDNAESISFPARRIYTDAAPKVDPSLQWEVGKTTEVVFTVRTQPSLAGAIRNTASAETWGICMTPASP